MAFQAGEAAEDVVDAVHVVGDVVQAGRPWQHGDAVMPLVAAQEGHEVADPVRQAKAQHLDEELHRRLVVGRVQDDVADPLGHALPALDRAGGAARDVRGDFEWQAVGAEEAEAVAAAQALQWARLEDDPAARGRHLGEEGVHVRAAWSGQRDDVNPLLLVLAQAHHIGLVMAGGGEVRHAVLVAGVDQAPDITIEGPLRLQVGKGVADVSDFTDAAHGILSEACGSGRPS